MRVTADHLHDMARLIEPLDTPSVRQAYREGRFPRADKVKDLDTRYRWDLFAAAKVWQIGLYDHGYTDAHIDTALRRIVRPLGAEAEEARIEAALVAHDNVFGFGATRLADAERARV